MIEQKLKQPGLLPEKLSSSIFPVDADLVFFPTPGVFVNDFTDTQRFEISSY